MGVVNLLISHNMYAKQNICFSKKSGAKFACGHSNLSPLTNRTQESERHLKMLIKFVSQAAKVLVKSLSVLI